MKILLVSWHFPPHNTIAGIRLGKLASYLAALGHDVRVITSAKPDTDCSLPNDLGDERVLRTPFIDIDAIVNPLAWRERFASRWRGAPAGAPAPRRAGRGAGQSRLSKLYRQLIFIPDRYNGWMFPLLQALRRLQASWGPDIIMVSGPPFSAFVAVAIFAARTKVPWIAEFRDRWADDPYALIPEWRRFVDRRIEALTVSRADGLVTVSEPWSRHYAGVYRLPVVTVMNGFDPRDFAALQLDAAQPDLPLRIVYTGFVYPERRDPTPLFRAIRESGIGPDELRIVFFGSRSDYLEACIDDIAVRAWVDVHDPIPYGEAVRQQALADVLLLLQWDSPADESNIPGKLFEYLAVRRPILGLGPLGGIPACFVRERGAGLYGNDPSVIAGQLRLWVAQKRRHGRLPSLPPEVSAGLERDQQYARLASFQTQLAAERSPRGEHAAADGSNPLAATLHGPLFAVADTSRLDRPMLCVIVDTEADFDWAAPFSREGHRLRSIDGIARVQALFDRFGVKPTYLVDHPIATDPAAIRILRNLLEQGRCEIGVQLHAWTTPPFDELLCERNSYGCNLPRQLQEAKLASLTDAVARAFAIEPKVFKAGRYGFADVTAELLEQAGFLVDTSVLPFTSLAGQGGPSFHDVPDRPFWFGRKHPVLELPVTRHFAGLLRGCAPGRLHRMIDSRLGRSARLPGILARLGLLDRLTLTPEGMSYANMRALATGLVADGRRVLTLSFHSPSLASGNTPYVRTEADLAAFMERLTRFAAFFFEELGGEARTALELHRSLLPPGRAVAIPATAPPHGRPLPAAR
jgi:glycosyltransferase involved in cell wall biosynthesis